MRWVITLCGNGVARRWHQRHIDRNHRWQAAEARGRGPLETRDGDKSAFLCEGLAADELRVWLSWWSGGRRWGAGGRNEHIRRHHRAHRHGRVGALNWTSKLQVIQNSLCFGRSSYQKGFAKTHSCKTVSPLCSKGLNMLLPPTFMEFAGIISLVRAPPSQHDWRAKWSSAGLQNMGPGGKKRRNTLQHLNSKRWVKQEQRCTRVSPPIGVEEVHIQLNTETTTCRETSRPQDFFFFFLRIAACVKLKWPL